MSPVDWGGGRCRPVRSAGPLALALLGAWPCAAPVAGQVIGGRTLDRLSGSVVPEVALELVDSTATVRATTRSDLEGWFILPASRPGTYRVRGSAAGYAAFTSEVLSAGPGEEVEIELALDPSAVDLAPIRVVVRRGPGQGALAGYYQRADRVRRTGMGRIMARAEIAEGGTERMSTLLARVPRRAGCPMGFLVNGLPAGPEQIEALHPGDVEGIEVYNTGADVPLEFKRYTRCAITLVWLRQEVPEGERIAWRPLLLVVGGIALLVTLLR